MSSPTTQKMQDLLQRLKNSILADARVLATFEHFAAVPDRISKTTWALPESVVTRTPLHPPASVSAYFEDHFPSSNVSPERYVATSDDDINPASGLLIHHAIHTAFSERSTDLLLQFLVVVIMVHDIGHTLRGSFWGFPTEVEAREEFPYYRETSTSGWFYRETGLDVEIALFGGILGAVFEDEPDDVFPFFELDFNRIAHFCLTSPGQLTYKIGKSMFFRSAPWR